MLEIAQNFEQTVAKFSPVVLIGPGLAAVLVGLFIWLGGLGFRKVLAAAIGAISGGICAFFITGRNIILAGAIAGISAVIAVVFERIFITILAAALAAVFSFAVLARPYIESTDSLKQHPEYEISNQAKTLSVHQTAEIIKTYTANFSTNIKEACSQMPSHSWVIIVALVIIFIVAGFFLWRLTSALCCAALGTTLVFAGMISLLLYKGAAPISCISRKQPFYATAFIAMIAFGTIEQLLLCRSGRKKLIRKKEANKNREGPGNNR